MRVLALAMLMSQGVFTACLLWSWLALTSTVNTSCVVSSDVFVADLLVEGTWWHSGLCFSQGHSSGDIWAPSWATVFWATGRWVLYGSSFFILWPWMPFNAASLAFKPLLWLPLWEGLGLRGRRKWGCSGPHYLSSVQNWSIYTAFIIHSVRISPLYPHTT